MLRSNLSCLEVRLPDRSSPKPSPPHLGSRRGGGRRCASVRATGGAAAFEPGSRRGGTAGCSAGPRPAGESRPE